MDVTYFISYTPLTSRKRQASPVTVPEGRNHVVITGLDGGTEYSVTVYTANSDGSGAGPLSESQRAPPLGECVCMCVCV